MDLPIQPLTRGRALAQAFIVLGLLLGWVLGSSWLGVGILSRHPVAPLVHAALTGVLALALVYAATAGDESRWRSLGLQRPSWLTTVLFGMLGAGAAYVLSGILAGAYMLALGGAKELAEKVHALEVLGSLPFWSIVPVALFAGFYEEVLFRGFLLGRLRSVFGESKGGIAAAVLISSAVFAAGHIYQGPVGVLQTFAAGACFAVLAALTKSLWPSIISHAAIDLFGLFALHYLKPFLEKALQQQGIHGIP